MGCNCFIKSSEINPIPDFFPISLCIQTSAQLASKVFNLLFPTKLEIIPERTSPIPITANSLVELLFHVIYRMTQNNNARFNTDVNTEQCAKHNAKVEEITMKC